MLVGFARVSTADQHAGFESQIDELKAAGCERIFGEKISAVARCRPELENALAFVREGDCLVVTKLDRLCRSTAHFVEITKALQSKGVTLRILSMNLDTGSSTGKLMLSLMSSIGQFEREILLERQRAGIQRAKAAGKYRGRQPTARARANEVAALHRSGMKAADIAITLSISKSSVYRLLPAMTPL